MKAADARECGIRAAVSRDHLGSLADPISHDQSLIAEWPVKTSLGAVISPPKSILQK